MSKIKIECSHCNAVYKIDEARIPNKLVRFNCKKCEKISVIDKNSLNRIKQDHQEQNKFCPKCNAPKSQSDTECGLCGVIYEKVESRKKEILTKKIREEKKVVEKERRKQERSKKIKGLPKALVSKIIKLIRRKNGNKNIPSINDEIIKKGSFFKLKSGILKIGVKSKYPIPIFSFFLLAAIIFIANYVFLQSPLNTVINDDHRNKDISVDVHYGYYVDVNTLVYNLKDVSENKSMADVFRVFLQFAEKLKDRKFNKVLFQYRSEDKFYIKGLYFQKLGDEFSFQNPAYTVRTFPENVFSPDGSKAFSSWSGGFLGVLGKQMEDFNSFHRQWYLTDMLGGSVKINNGIQQVNNRSKFEFETRKANCGNNIFNLDMKITKTCLRRNTDIYQIDYSGVSRCLEKQEVCGTPLEVKHCVEEWGGGPKNVDVRMVYTCLIEIYND